MKPRSDSLYATLQRAGKLDEFFMWFYSANPSYEAMQKKFTEWHIETSAGAISNLISRHGLHWKVREALTKAEASKEALPGNADKLIQERFRQNEFDLVFGELTNKEKIALLKIDVEREKMRQADEKLDFEQERWREAKKSALEKAIDALYEECKGNKAALKAWKQLREAVMKEMEE